MARIRGAGDTQTAVKTRRSSDPVVAKPAAGKTAAPPTVAKPKPTDQTVAPKKAGPVNLGGASHAHVPVPSAESLYSSVGLEIIEKQPRPPDVEQARTTFSPSAYTAKQKKWAGIVAEALEQLGGARVMIKRPAEDALALLTNGGRLSTIFDLKNPSEEVQGYLTGRLAHEQRLGTHGVGAQAGQTVYGSVEFAARRSPELFDDAILKAAKAQKPLPRSELNTGFPLTHDAITLVMKPTVNANATFLPGDSYIATAHPPRAAEHLAYVVLDNILEQGDMYFTAERGSDVMFELPRDQAVDAVKTYLTSGAVNRNYLEAQLRAPTVEDVAYIVIRNDPQASPVAADGRTLEAMLGEIRSRAAERGIKIVEEKHEV